MKKLIQNLLVVLFCAGIAMVAFATEEEAKEAAKKAREQLKEMGFQVRETYLIGVLDNGESSVFSRTFYQDNEYVLVVTGSKRARDIDVYVFDDDGRLVAQDSDASPISVNTFKADYTGTYYIKVVMYDSVDDNVYWVFQYGYR